MWDELTVASLIDPSVITETETMWLDVDITHGPKYGHTVVWSRPSSEPQPSFFRFSGPEPMDLDKWKPLSEPPSHLHPSTVQMAGRYRSASKRSSSS